MWRKNGVEKEAKVFSEQFELPRQTSNLEKVMGLCTALWKMLLFWLELARLKKNIEKNKEMKKKNILAVWRLSGSVLSKCFLVSLGVLFVMKTLEDER